MIKKKEYRNCKRLYSQRGKDNQVKPNPLGVRNDKKGGKRCDTIYKNSLLLSREALGVRHRSSPPCRRHLAGSALRSLLQHSEPGFVLKPTDPQRGYLLSVREGNGRSRCSRSPWRRQRGKHGGNANMFTCRCLPRGLH